VTSPGPATAIRAARPADVEAITALYNQYIDTRTIEWTERRHTVTGRAAWLAAKQHDRWPVLVADLDGEVVGVATYGDFRDSTAREGYRFVVEHSIHVAEHVHGRGIGTALMRDLIDHARAAGLHAMIGGIDGENPESIEFHRRLGFVEVGRLPDIGYKFDRWLTLVFVQLRL
jgi:phosphinothricin acetyltransferase